jgi:hypothetical protein
MPPPRHRRSLRDPSVVVIADDLGETSVRAQLRLRNLVGKRRDIVHVVAAGRAERDNPGDVARLAVESGRVVLVEGAVRSPSTAAKLVTALAGPSTLVQSPSFHFQIEPSPALTNTSGSPMASRPALNVCIACGVFRTFCGNSCPFRLRRCLVPDRAVDQPLASPARKCFVSPRKIPPPACNSTPEAVASIDW